MSKQIVTLTPLQLDALKEIGNIGAGNAATALSQLLNRRIEMTVPQVSVLPLNDVPEVVGGAETIVAGVFLRVFGSAPGNILFILPRDSAFYLVDTLMGQESGTTKSLREIDESALKEVGNILASAYLTALSFFTRLTLLPSIPALAVDMAGALLSVVLIQLGQMGDYALVIETEFKDDCGQVKGHFFLVPDPGSLDAILRTIGVNGHGADY